MKKQVGSILDKMHKEEFKTVQPYLNECYEKSFIGNMYVLHEEGIPLIIPIDQEKVVRAVQLDSKISGGLYRRLGEDVGLLKRRITAEVSRGIATGMSYDQMARQLASRTKIGYNNAVRITRTEGHRIQQQSTMDACYATRDRGADVVKQWDAVLDVATRESHQMLDGQIRELDDKFSNGLMYPGDPAGSAAEVINCRCILLQRALDKELIDECYVLITKVEYPDDVIECCINLCEWEVKNRGKVGIKAETLSRHSVTYFDQDASNQMNGYPVSLLGCLKPYRKARC